MSHILSYTLNKEVIIIGRIAGQYAKPRSNPFEDYEGNLVEVYRGDIVNDISPTNRMPDPERMLCAYNHSIATM